jgi:glycerophosphoryl diester phosphodiesterase
MEVSSLRVLHELDHGVRLGWTVPKVTRDWNSMPWAKPLVIAGLISLRRRLPGEVRREASGLGVRSIWAYDPVITPRLARACHDVGLELIAWTVDEPQEMQRLAALGVDGICTNDPRLFAELDG